MNSSLEAYIRRHPIECMFFSEFDHKIGPKITYEYPEGYFQQQNGLFEQVVSNVIPKPELREKLTTVNTGEKKVIGCAVCIEGAHYPRNNHIFNFGLVLGSKHKSSPCIPMIRHLSKYMTQLEKSRLFVSQPDTKKLIPDILKSMFLELNKHGCCSVQVDVATTLYLKVFPPTTTPPDVKNHDVPILMVSVDDIATDNIDLTAERILPYIDGFRHIQKIAAFADVDPGLTRLCIRDLVFYGVVELISIFQYSNTYTTTPDLSKFMKDKSLQDQCIKYVTRPGYKSPSLHVILKIFCGLTPGVTVDSLCYRMQKELGQINERRLIQFGLIHKLIRRIHIYPLLNRRMDCSDDVSPYCSKCFRTREVASRLFFTQDLYRFCTGMYSTDQICCETGLSFKELMSRLEQNPQIFLCRK